MSDDDRTIWEWLEGAVKLYFKPLQDAAFAGPDAVTEFVQDATGLDEAAIAGAINAFHTSTASLIESATRIRDLDALQDALSTLLDAWTTLQRTVTGAALAALLEYLTIEWIWESAPRVYSALAFLHVIDKDRLPGDRLQWGNAEYLFKPKNVLPDLYGWGSTFAADDFLRRLTLLGSTIGAPGRIASPSDAAVADLGLTSGGRTSPSVMVIPLLRKIEADVLLNAGIDVIATGGGPATAAVMLLPYGVAGFTPGPLGPKWNLSITASVAEGLGIAFRPPAEITPVSVGSPLGDVRAQLKLSRSQDYPWALSLGSGIGASAGAIDLALDGSLGSNPSFDAKLSVYDGQLAIRPDASDGFLAKIVPEGGVSVQTDFTLEWNSASGLTFSASGGLETSIPLHLELGPITLDTLHLGAFLEDGLINVEGRLDLSAEIGPVTAAVAGLGARLEMTLDDEIASDERFSRVGPFGVDIALVPPTGIGCGVDAGGVVFGGGFVSYDEKLHQYAGILALQLSEIAVVAVAIVTTRLPGNKPGYALFLQVGITFNPAIQLPYNLQLVGVGGFLALNRTLDIAALRSGLRNNTLDLLLFPDPQTVIRDSARTITAINTVAPIQEGRTIVAPMVKLGWGPNSIILADICVAIEFPAPIIIALLGQISAMFPKPDGAIVILNLDILGVLDVAKKSLSIDATLHDSKILTYDLYGDSAIRLSFGSTKVFAMSLGGWAPGYTPPPNFPSLRRLTLQLSSSKSFDLSATAYQALTSNTLQFGARLQLHAEACGVDIEGHLSMDTLINWSPFEFAVAIDGSVSAQFHGHDIASVHLSLEVSGPTPWHVKGKAKVSVLGWAATARIDKSFGRDDKERLPSIDPYGPFIADVSNPSSWGSAVLPRRKAVESLKSITMDGTTAQGNAIVLVHPVGTLEVRQRTLPLGMDLEKFGNADITGSNHFDISLELGPTPPPSGQVPFESVNVDEYFASGQFFAMSKADRLSKPSYEPFKGGEAAGPTLPRLDGGFVPVDLQFESLLIRADGSTEPARDHPRPDWLTLRRTIAQNALFSLRTRGLGKFGVPGVMQVKVQAEGWAVVNKSSLTRETSIQTSTTRLNHTQADHLARSAAGAVMVVAEFEEETT